MKRDPKIHGHTIVLLGNFNPTIFQPAWFANENLLQKAEVESATIDVIHADIVAFSLPWLTLQVTRQRFAVETFQMPYFEVIRDLVIGTFALLRYTPINLMGINFTKHIAVESLDEWHAIGHKLAPKDVWESLLLKPGMRSLSMQGMRDDERGGYVLVQIEPSPKVTHGIYIAINEHYESPKTALPTGSDEVMDVLKERWTVSYKNSERIISSLMERL